MTAKKATVNLDAMIAREDFANINDSNNYPALPRLSVNDFEGLVVNMLRKPDFQRETNHWSPEQIVAFLESFINGDLIPSVILWKSPTHVFVIDGGHRLSVLRAWVLNDYGDGQLSKAYFGEYMPDSQKVAANKTRNLVETVVGSYSQYKERAVKADVDQKTLTVFTRDLQVQWVSGNSKNAEDSFFKINKQGTPLDGMEVSLLRHRNKPIAIAARAVIRAGKGNKYWSAFSAEKALQIEELSKSLHTALFDPEVPSLVKTLDLPMGGAKGIGLALQILVDYLGIACMSQNHKPAGIDSGGKDVTGEATITVLKRAQKLGFRLTGNDKGSLGLHPAVYYYGPTGVHSSAMFLGTSKFISEKLANNNNNFFKQFTLARAKIEECLINNKDLIATILQKVYSGNRVKLYDSLLENIFSHIKKGGMVTEKDIVAWAGLANKTVVGSEEITSNNISESSKNRVFINTALEQAVKCPICQGYLHIAKSVSYDHKIPKREGGLGGSDNVQMVHPFCNSMKA